MGRGALVGRGSIQRVQTFVALWLLMMAVFVTASVSAQEDPCLIFDQEVPLLVTASGQLPSNWQMAGVTPVSREEYALCHPDEVAGAMAGEPEDEADVFADLATGTGVPSTEAGMPTGPMAVAEAIGESGGGNFKDFTVLSVPSGDVNKPSHGCHDSNID